MENIVPAILATKPNPPIIKATPELISRTEAKVSWNDQKHQIGPIVDGEDPDDIEDNSTNSNYDNTRNEVYKVSWWTDETDTRSVEIEKREYTLTKLLPGSKYFVTVVEILGDIYSPPSNTVDFKTAPKAPGRIQVRNYEKSPHDSLIVHFKNENDEEMSHIVTVQPIEGEPIEKKVSKETDFALVQGLTPGQNHSIRVKAVDEECNRKVQDSDSTKYESLVQTYPTAPKRLEVEIQQKNRLKLTWSECDMKSNSYRIYCNEMTKYYETADTSFTIDDVKPSTNYKFGVSAVNNAGESKKSEDKEFKTAPSTQFQTCE